jgi:hypothetical protein
VVGEPRSPLVQHHVERLLGRKILPDVRLDLISQVVIVENPDLHVEDRRFLGTRVGGRPIADLRESLLRPIDRVAQPLDLHVNGIVGNDARRDVRHLPPQEVDGADDDTGRGGDSLERSIHVVRIRRTCSR